LYSFSGSITITSTHKRRYLKISSFVVKDFPAQDVAKITSLAFGSFFENLLNITKPHVCLFIQYKIHSSSDKSFDINGKLQPSEVVTMLLEIPKSSIHKGKQLLKPSSILKAALFIFIQ
jgi:hypothetical protein